MQGQVSRRFAGLAALPSLDAFDGENAGQMNFSLVASSMTYPKGGPNEKTFHRHGSFSDESILVTNDRVALVAWSKCRKSRRLMKRIVVDPRSLTEMQVEKRLPPRPLALEATNAGFQSRREAVAFRRAAAATAVEATAALRRRR